MQVSNTPRLTREQKARQMGRQGYSISECVNTVGVFFIGKADGAEPYIVDVAGGTCTCFDYCRNGAPCKHQMFVALCCRWWMKLTATVKPRTSRRATFSAKHVQRFRDLSPVFAAPAPMETPATGYGSMEYKAKIAQDF